MRARHRRSRQGNGLALPTLTFTEAYRDALYAVMLEEVEGLLKDPRARDRVRQLTRDLLVEMLGAFDRRSRSRP